MQKAVNDTRFLRDAQTLTVWGILPDLGVSLIQPIIFESVNTQISQTRRALSHGTASLSEKKGPVVEQRGEPHVDTPESTTTTNPIDLAAAHWDFHNEVYAGLLAGIFLLYFASRMLMEWFCYSHESGPCGHRHPWPLRR